MKWKKFSEEFPTEKNEWILCWNKYFHTPEIVRTAPYNLDKKDFEEGQILSAYSYWVPIEDPYYGI